MDDLRSNDAEWGCLLGVLRVAGMNTYYFYLWEGPRFSVEAGSLEHARMAFKVLGLHEGLGWVE